MASAARRQPSSTSLSKYARAHSPDFADHSYDFCNAFWGLGDVGVDVLFARLRGAMRTTEELRNFWKERAAIEDQYSKRLAALSRLTLGRDEIGELRTSLDTLRLETEKQSGFHSKLAQQIKDDLEGGSNIFMNKQLQHKRQVQSPIEKEFKIKQQQEAHVQRAREKYESDCVKINSWTAQSTLIQGRDLEKVQQKLRNAQQTVTVNERDFAQFARELQETTSRWEVRWKEFCDKCQDLEEERLEFMKDHMWGYANAISTVCVADDESCEKLRLSLESMEPEKDMENFVRDYGTGNSIPDPPAFVNYTDPNAVPSSSQRPTTRPAHFDRTTRRVRQMMPLPPEPREDENAPVENTAGVGAGGGRGEPPMSRSRSRSASRASMRNQTQAQDRGVAPPVPPQTSGTTMTNGRGDGGAHGPAPPATNGNSPVKVGQENDPLARQLAELQRGIGSMKRTPSAQARSGGSPRQPSPAQGQGQRQGGQTHQPKESVSQLAPPPGARGGGPPDRNPEWRRSADLVVGSFPPNVPLSRPTSPNQPTPVMMTPSNSIPDNSMVKNVVDDYQQSFPGERKSVSRPGSRAGSINGSVQGQPQAVQQPRPESMAGVGAQGRSPSPQPFVPPSRDTSPMQRKAVSPIPQQWAPNPAPRAPSPYQSPPQVVQQQPASQPAQMGRQSGMRNAPPGAVATAINGVRRGQSISVPQAQPVRATSPNQVGIALDPTGRVSVDVMADRFLQRQPSVQQPSYRPQQPLQQPPIQQQSIQQQPIQQQPPIQQQQIQQQIQQQPQRQPSYPPQTQPVYAPPPPAAAPMYGYPQAPSQAPPVAQPPPQPGYGQQYPQYGYNGVNGQPIQRQVPVNTQYYGNPPPQAPQQPYGRPVSPAPPPQRPPQQAPLTPAGYTDDGRPILFYVKALYDYEAVIEEEFDFQSGDIIAVTATPEDGWWSGELLDEQRRQPGRHVFPSNFVDLLQ